jgi:hypothetical protein
LPKLRDVERTKNLKGGAINFLVACLAPGLCDGGNARPLTTLRQHFGADATMVGGKLSVLLPISVGASALTINLLEDRKSLGFQRRFGVREL